MTSAESTYHFTRLHLNYLKLMNMAALCLSISILILPNGDDRSKLLQRRRHCIDYSVNTKD